MAIEKTDLKIAVITGVVFSLAALLVRVMTKEISQKVK